MKKCSRCSKLKAHGDFNKDKRASDGLRSECKQCACDTNARWRQDNQERYLTYKASYYGTPRAREVGRQREQKRRARKRGNEEFLVTIQDIQRLMAQPCVACGSREDLTVDHIVPIARGGAHSVGNLMTLCQLCNSSKGSMLWTEWRFSTKPRALEVFVPPKEAP